jgi:alpha-amylase
LLHTYITQTSLPAGTYCDIISGNLENGSCTGKSITVGGDGSTTLSISNQDLDPVVALHVGVGL